MEEVLGKDSVLNAEPRQPTSPAVAWAVRVGYRDYRIIQWDAAEAKGRWGECDNVRGEIGIQGDMDPANAANSMLHEIMHACWYVANMRKREPQERAVTCLANQLTQVWRDNPALVEWINVRLAPQP